MAGRKTKGKNSARAAEVTIEIWINDKKQTFAEPAPEGVPPTLFQHLAEFWRRGFSACLNRRQAPLGAEEGGGVDLSQLAEPLSGRPPDPETQARGRKAWELHEKRLTYGQIALQLCPKRQEPHHRCGRKCADRLRQEAYDYKHRRYIEELLRTE